MNQSSPGDPVKRKHDSYMPSPSVHVFTKWSIKVPVELCHIKQKLGDVQISIFKSFSVEYYCIIIFKKVSCATLRAQPVIYFTEKTS